MEKASKPPNFHDHKAKVINICTVCNAPAVKACGICLTDYCSEECQNKDWPLHQRLCEQLAKVSAPQNKKVPPQNQNVPPQNQNQAPTVPTQDRPNVRRRDPRLQRGPPRVPQPVPSPSFQQVPPPGFQQIPPCNPQPVLPPNFQQFPPSNLQQNPPCGPRPIPPPSSQKIPPPLQIRPNVKKNVKAEHPSNFCAQTKRSFPPPRIDIPENSCQYDKLKTLPYFSDIDENIRRVDPRFYKYQSFDEPTQNMARDSKRKFESTKPIPPIPHPSEFSNPIRPNKSERNYNDSELFTRRPPKVMKNIPCKNSVINQDIPVDSPVRIEPKSELPKIRVKSFDSLREIPEPKPPSEKITTKLLRNLDKEFSSFYGPKTDEDMEDLPDMEALGDLDDLDMDTGPEKVDVIGLSREGTDKYWVIKETNYTLWKTMEEDVKKCERNREIRPVINTIGACSYEGEWYRGKIIRVRPIMKVHFIDHGNTEIYRGVVKELPVELRQVKPLAFLIQFTENTPSKYLTKDLDGCKFEVEIIEKLENGVRLVRIPHKEPKVKKPQVSYTLPTYSEKRPVILCGFDLNTVFVRPIDENSSVNFEKLQHEIDNHVARETRLFVNPPAEGEMVCARCDMNQTYYRARVVFVGDGDVVRVKFVDHHREEQDTLLKYLKPLSEDLKSRADFIIRLTLANVPFYPPPPEVVSYYNNLITSKSKLIMSFQDGAEEVILDEEVTGIVVNDHVFRMIFNKLKQSELLLDNSLKFINLNSGDRKKLIISFIDREEFDKSTIFYVTDPNHESYDYVNEKLASEISAYCNNEQIGFTPELKELCLAKYEGGWYRGINLESIDDTQFRIFFIDYGNESVVHNSDIRRMPKEFSEPPCLAIRSTIAGSKKLIKNKKLNDDIFDYLESNINNCIADVEVCDVIEDGLTSLTTLRFLEIQRALDNV